ncbi:MAG: DUF1926 domain-containing protein [Dictyoglomi bacterium]|nr:DUF1926 domain-containing protein [Dictyoglomota bacterium]
MGNVYFILGIHNHQPTGNFDHVFQWAYDHAYKPFLEVLKQYPEIKISIHHSGPLVDWLLAKHIDYIEEYRKLASEGRVEIMGGAYYEPILPIIPDEDKMGQLLLMKKKMKEILNYNPVGVWVPERVWEPYLPKFIAGAGYKYVVLDDVHFLYAGLKEEDLTWFYATEDSGKVVMAFPDLQILRYMIPFHTVENIEHYFRSFADRDEDVILVMADDGEKFGVWPGTYKHVYEEGWLHRFFEMLTRLMEEDWFHMITFEKAVDHFRPKGKVYMPTASYIEMTEWVLPPDMSKEFEALIKERQDIKAYLRGGHWRMFFSKYYESNLMKSRMLEASKVVSSTDDAERKESAKMYLYRGQTNCAYWHGVFGGLYLPHLRRAIYENLIKAEMEALGDSKRIEVIEKDFDSDGYPEVIVRRPELFAVVDTEHGALIELDFYAKAENLINVMSRYKEAYHDKVYEAVSPDELDGTKTIHEVVLAKEKDLAKYLVYDKWHYMAFLDFVGNYEPNAFFRGEVNELPYTYNRWHISDIGAVFSSVIGRKYIRILEDGVDVSYDMSENITVLVPIAFYDPSITVNIDGLSHPVSSVLDIHKSSIFVEVPFLGIKHILMTDGEIIGSYPIFTVSNSEAGFEKVYQGTVFVIKIKTGSIKWGVTEI